MECHIKNHMHTLKLRSDFGGKVLKLVMSMSVTLVRLKKWMDIQIKLNLIYT